jgi:RHS repeat-associated protein
MQSKRNIFLSIAVCFSFLMVLGAPSVGAQQTPAVTGANLSGGGYEAKVQALRAAFAAERELLGLPNLTGPLPSPESDLGEPTCSASGGGASAGKGAPSSACFPSSKGAPVWRVNMVNLNFYMQDTPLWYESPVGPPVELKLSYNSFTSAGGSFGQKWQLNYGTYLYSAVNDFGVYVGKMILMPDGKLQLYTPAGSGVYTSPYQAYNTLVEISANRFELQFQDGTVYVYDIPNGVISSVSLLVEMRDAYGQRLILGYSGDAKLVTITDALGKVTTLSYNGEGLVTQAADPFGRTALFEYDANGNLSKITDMGGYWTGFTYRHYVLTDYYLESLTNPAGTWGFYFEPPDWLGDGSDPYPAPGAEMGDKMRITVTNPFGGKEEYYRSGMISWYIAPRDYIPYISPTNNNYANNAPKTQYLLTTVNTRRGEVDTVTTPEGDTISFSYDDDGNITGVISGLSYLSYTYNLRGNITSVTRPNSTATTFTYAANGVDPTGITDDALGTIVLAYNSAHDIVSHTDRLGNTKTITYNGYGQVSSTTDQLNVTTDFIYDSNRRLVQISRNGHTLKSFTYDTVGRVRTCTDATGATLTYDYNNLDDITRITYPDGRHKDISYSSAFPRLVTAVTDRAGLTSHFFYNAANKVYRIVNPEGGIIDFNYDANGNRSALTDPLGRVTTFAYNLDNRLARKTFPDGAFTTYAYLQGRLYSVTGARNLSKYYQYDANGNLAQTSYTADLSHYTFPVMYQYDPYRRMTAMVDAAGTTAFSYNAGSLLTAIDGPWANDTLSLQHDAKGRMTGYTLERGQSVSFNYDAFERLTQIGSGAGAFTYAYAGASPLAQRLTRPNGSYTEYQYDSMNRLTRLTNKRNTGEIINQYEYTYNDQDLKASETVTNGAPVTSFITGSKAFTYNNLNQLLSSTNPSRPYAYDVEGNMTQWESPTGRTFTGVYDIENRLTSARYEYMSSGPPMEYESYTGNYVYRGNGFLAEKEVEFFKYSTNEYSQTKVRYIGYGVLPLQERDGNNNVLREYTWGINVGGGIGGLLSLNQGGQNYYYLYDGKGNVTAIIDSSQAVVATYVYDPFGNLLTKTGAFDQPYRFSTKPYDEKTGLAYYGFRFYSPTAERWTTRDPLGLAGGINLYAFVSNDPVNSVDPFGLEETAQDRLDKLRQAAEESNRQWEEKYGNKNKWFDDAKEKVKDFFKTPWDYWSKKAKRVKDVWCSSNPRDGFDALDMIPKKTPVNMGSPSDYGRLGAEYMDVHFERTERMGGF